MNVSPHKTQSTLS